jgi:hypothetical protein
LLGGKRLPIVGEKSHYCATYESCAPKKSLKNGGIPPFSRFGTAHAKNGSSGGKVARKDQEGNFEMNAFSNFANRAAAAVAAMGMSAFLLVGYFYIPSVQIASGMVA